MNPLLFCKILFGGGINDSKTPDMLKSIEMSKSEEEAMQVLNELQGYAWEEHIPVTVLASYNTLYGATNKVEGISTFAGPIFWNTKVLK